MRVFLLTQKHPGFKRPLARHLALFCVGLLTAIGGWAAQGAPQTATAVAPGELLLNLDRDNSEIHWTLGSTLHTVHGTFKFKSGELRVNPGSGKASGKIVVSATSADSGNDRRDKKMHKDVLESGQYPEMFFTVDRVEGKVAASGSSNVLLHGTMNLHGTNHEFGAPVQAVLSGDHWKATAKFTVPYVKWGLKNPSSFLLHVKPDVDIELNMAGTWKGSPGDR